MDKQDWAPEPLVAKEITSSSGTMSGLKGYHIMGIDKKEFLFTEDLSPTILRLITCYNACAGVPTEDLDYMAERKLMPEAVHKFLSTFKHQRIYDAIIPDAKEAPHD